VLEGLLGLSLAFPSIPFNLQTITVLAVRLLGGLLGRVLVRLLDLAIEQHATDRNWRAGKGGGERRGGGGGGGEEGSEARCIRSQVGVSASTSEHAHAWALTTHTHTHTHTHIHMHMHMHNPKPIQTPNSFALAVIRPAAHPHAHPTPHTSHPHSLHYLSPLPRP